MKQYSFYSVDLLLDGVAVTGFNQSNAISVPMLDKGTVKSPDEILNADLYFIDKIGLKEHLSPTRSNGLLSMVKQIRMYALAFKAKEGK